jgi:hypothetical protein
VRTEPGGTTPGSAERRFPGYDVVARSDKWDATTTAVVLGRLEAPGPAKFFDAAEEAIVRALLDRLLAQDEEPRVPVFEQIDGRLAGREGDGYHYDDLPQDPEAWRLSVAALDAEARSTVRLGFADLDRQAQRDIIERVRLCDGTWQDLPAQHVFSLWMRYACGAYYAHPWAWNEIGFGGPAYPTGYKHLALDGRENWEVQERDAHDPVPWAQQAEEAKKRHAAGLSQKEEPD